jgi:hypothetical protein
LRSRAAPLRRRLREAQRARAGVREAKDRADQRATRTALVIDRFLANGQDQAAKEYFDAKAKDRIAGDDITKVEAKLKVASTMGEGQRGAVAVWDKLGPKNDLDPINLDKMVGRCARDVRRQAGDFQGCHGEPERARQHPQRGAARAA